MVQRVQKSTKESMKYVVSVSKKGKNIWKVYGYDYNDDDNLVFQCKRINPLLAWFYKLKKCHRKNLYCNECNRKFLSIGSMREIKNEECPYCYES